MERPKNIFQKVRDNDILDYITYLEDQQRLLNQNNDAKVYVTMSKQMDHFNEQIKELDLSLDLDEDGRNKNFKNFEKFDKLTDLVKKTTEKLTYFKNRTTPEEIEKEEKAYSGPVERYVFTNLKKSDGKGD